MNTHYQLLFYSNETAKKKLIEITKQVIHVRAVKMYQSSIYLLVDALATLLQHTNWIN